MEDDAAYKQAADGITALRRFRERFYGCLERRADALFELCDAILTTGAPPSPVHLSLTTAHRRGWCSLYAALSRGSIDDDRMRDLLASREADDAVPPPVYAVDVSPWPRCDAEASPGRSYLYHPSRHSAGQPIVAGWAYQLVVELSFERDSWVAPVDVRRVRPDEDSGEVAAEQVASLADRLPERSAAPLFVFDAGYDPVRLQKGLEGTRAQILVRLHSGRTFYAEPEVTQKRPVGRPSRHGELRDELSSLRSRSEHAAAELERIPVLHSRATLEDDVDKELRLKERYQDLKEEKQTAEARLPEVEAELRLLSPQQGDRDELVMLHQYGNVNRIASAPLVELKRLASEVSDAATSAAGHFEQVLNDRQGESWSWRQNVSWSEEARDALRKAGSVPGEDRTQVIKKDPERLSKRGAERI